MFAPKKLLENLLAGLNNVQVQQQRIEIESSKIYDLMLMHNTEQRQRQHVNPLNRCGNRCFSQSDEDGITIEIMRRLAVQKGTFVEFGVGDGRENNTLVLAAMGWQGFWVGGENLAFDVPKTNRFTFTKSWVTLNNVVDLTRDGLAFLGNPDIDLLSLDLDGNDYFLIEKLLENGVRSKVFVVEYNAKFMPPIEFCIDYNAEHSWGGNDYFGASLCSFVRLFKRFNYTLVCCNSHSGANAFFVDNSFMDQFSDVPRTIEELYVEPRYFLANRFAHPVAIQTLQKILS